MAGRRQKEKKYPHLTWTGFINAGVRCYLGASSYFHTVISRWSGLHGKKGRMSACRWNAPVAHIVGCLYLTNKHNLITFLIYSLPLFMRCLTCSEFCFERLNSPSNIYATSSAYSYCCVNLGRHSSRLFRGGSSFPRLHAFSHFNDFITITFDPDTSDSEYIELV